MSKDERTPHKRNMMKKRYSTILAAVLIAGGWGTLSSCTSAADQQQAAEALARTQRSVERLQGVLNKAEGAMVRVMMTGVIKEQEFPLPAEEFAQLKGILARTGAVPPLKPSEEEPPGEQGQAPYYIELVLLGKGGEELLGIVLNEEPWLRESELERVKKEREHAARVPEWYLPDADWERLHALPTMPQARTWAEHE